jgi:Asp-tRNA(Asn)/Glu-tRNA(Gln) amidotransferase A subunit family amidase
MGLATVALVAVAVIAFVLALFLQPEIPITGSKKIVLGSKGYDIKQVIAPSADGFLLRVLSYVITRTPFGPAIRRKLLNDNDVSIVRELGSQVHIPPLYFPMKRVAIEDSLAAERVDTQEIFNNGIVADTHAKDKYRIGGNFVPRSIMEYAAAYRANTHKPSAVMQKTLQAAHDWEKEGFVIFSSLLDEGVMQQARASDERFASNTPLSILDGVPIAFKDSLEIMGHTTYNGYNPDPTYKEYWLAEHSARDDIMVKHFRSLGAIIFGLTVMVEGGVSPLGYNSHFHGPFNPYSMNRYSGGSSAGSAVVVATGLVPVAIGFDGGGSVRVPAAMSGIHGLATTYGRCPFDTDFDGVNIKSGPMTSCSDDALIALAVMAQTELTHFYSQLYDGGVQGPPAFYAYHHNVGSQLDLNGVRLGMYKEWFADSDDSVRERCEEVIDFLVQRGAEIVAIDIPHLFAMSLAHGIKLSSEMSQNWDRVYFNAPESMEANTRILLGLGLASSAVEVLSGEKLKAWASEYLDTLYKEQRLDAIITPTIGTEVPILADTVRAVGESNTGLVVKVMKFIFLANFLGLPGYSVPVGNIRPKVRYAAEPETVTVPVGFHLLGNSWTEHKLLRIGRVIEQGFVPAEKVVAKPLYSFDPLA